MVVIRNFIKRACYGGWVRQLLALAILIYFSAGKSCAQLAASDKSFSNRIEFRKIQWMAYHTQSLHIYFPKGSDSLPAILSREILSAKAIVVKRMGSSLRNLPSIIIYPSLSAQYESSIGSREDVPLTIPTFVSRGSRMVLYYDGSRTDLIQQLYEGLAQTIWQQELLQTGPIAQVSSALKKDPIPYWFQEGAVNYFAALWPLNQEEHLRRVLATDSPNNFRSLVAEYPGLGGAAFCYFLSQTFRLEAPQQVFGQLRKGKSLERALRLVTKRPADSLYTACFSWYQRRFQIVGSSVSAIDEVPPTTQKADSFVVATTDSAIPVRLQLPFNKWSRAKGHVLNTSFSPSGEQLAVVIAWPNHRRCVYLYNLVGKPKPKRILIYRLPPWLKDHNADQYPILAWREDPSGRSNELFIRVPQNGGIKVLTIGAEGRVESKESLPVVDGINSLNVVSNGTFLLGAWLKGQSDIVSYDPRRLKYTPNTNDGADDSQPTSNTSDVGGVQKRSSLANGDIFFCSVRKGDTSLGQDSLPLRHGIYRISGNSITPVITDTSSYNSFSNPILSNEKTLLFTATIRGRERLAKLDLATLPKAGAALDQVIVSDSDWAMKSFQVRPAANVIDFFQVGKDSISVRSYSLRAWLDHHMVTAMNLKEGPWLADFDRRVKQKRQEDSLLAAAKAAGGESFLDNIFSAAKSKNGSSKDSTEASTTFSPKKSDPYFVQLYSAYFSAQVNNDYFINRYQPYQAYQGSFKVPNVGGLATGGLSDLFEHHHLSFAYRLPIGSEGSMFFTKYRNTAKRLNWSLAYYRNVESIQPDPTRAWVDEEGRPYPQAAKVKTHYYETTLDYPLDYYTETGAAIFARKDKTVFLATNQYSLTFPPLTEIWLGLSPWLESKHLRRTVSGLYRGWDAKVNVDVFKAFTGKETGLGAINVSAQWHKPLYRYITLVLRAQAGASGGDQKILYNFGGVDNNLTPRIDTSVHFSQDAPYGFQKLVTPLRGFYQNSLYGSRYALINTDVYFPLFETLIPIETAFPSINHLQLGLFTDLAAAGGDSRYSTTGKGWQCSYGFSARTVLANYPMRFDMAWPGGFAFKPVWYLSLNLM